uniref:HEAT repeat domain-containing protein n=1 Tax=Leucobacter chromiireducens TaxID=283877 RepID=UPI000F63A7A7
MHTQATPTRAQRLAAALAVTDSSARLQAALTAGTRPEPSFVEPLIARCAVEPDFSVREMLTWALLRLPVELVLPRVLAELDPATASSALGQSQALHTVSKLGDPRAWPAITGELLHSSDEEIARTAWRAAVAVAPADARPELAAALVRELGRGDRELHRSLSRAIVGIGDPAL